MRTIAALLFGVLALHAQAPRRPGIPGVAHMGVYVSNVDSARTFYTKLLGYEEAFGITNPDGKLRLAFFKINDTQYVELFPEREAGSDRLAHIALETTDAEAMRAYLASKGIPVPDKVPVGRTGNANFTIKDPDGHIVEFTQYLPGGMPVKFRGKAMSSDRVSGRMTHVGIIVNSLEPAMRFYRDILGFKETWRGSRDGKVLNWVNMRVPDGTDYIEFMLHDPVPEPGKRGSAHHICLEVPDIAQSAGALKAKAGALAYTRPIEVRTGINRKRQLNLFDPDGTRVELMEPNTVDGNPAPSATAPPPK